MCYFEVGNKNESSENSRSSGATLTQLVYISRANRLLSESDLVELLAQARQRNAQHAITGMLLYKDMSFIQLLEGPQQAVELIFASIGNDIRHSRVRTLLQEPIEAPVFKDWSMGFQDLNSLSKKNLPGYSEFLNPSANIDSLAESPSSALELLHYFRTRS